MSITDLTRLAERGLDPLAEALEQHRVRFVQEILAAAVPSFWERRAEALEAARPRPGEFHGKATAAELRERDEALAEAAAACREHAEVVRRYPDVIAADMAAAVAAATSTPAPGLGVAS